MALNENIPTGKVPDPPPAPPEHPVFTELLAPFSPPREES